MNDRLLWETGFSEIKLLADNPLYKGGEGFVIKARELINNINLPDSGAR